MVIAEMTMDPSQARTFRRQASPTLEEVCLSAGETTRELMRTSMADAFRKFMEAVGRGNRGSHKCGHERGSSEKRTRWEDSRT